MQEVLCEKKISHTDIYLHNPQSVRCLSWKAYDDDHGWEWRRGEATSVHEEPNRHKKISEKKFFDAVITGV